MASPQPSIFETRRVQAFPILEKADMERLCRFGEKRSYAAGEYLAKAGEIGLGMFLILTGEVVVRQRDDCKPHDPIVTHGPGSFSGELAQLSGRPALLDAGVGGPVIVGDANNGDVLRLEGFLARNGHPSQRLDPETDPEAKALLERFHIEFFELPIVLCPNGQM